MEGTITRQIIGFRDLSDGERKLINEVKSIGVELGALIIKLRSDGIGADQRWLSIGETQLQQGLMALTRAIARPTSF